jgi:hypothetical protein
MQTLDPMKPSFPKCPHAVMYVPDKQGKNRVCTICSPVEIPFGAKHIIARNAAGQFVNILKG